MKTIKFELPYKDMDYLASLTEAISEHPEVILVTAFRDENDVIRDCTVSVRENSNTNEILFQLGVTVGMHASNYTLRMVEEQEILSKIKSDIVKAIFPDFDPEMAIYKQNEEENAVCNEADEKEKVQEETISELAKILDNFKKSNR